MATALAQHCAPVPAEPAPLDEGERLARLRLARSRNVGPRTYAHLLRRFGTAGAALEALPELAVRGGSADYAPCPPDAAEAEWEAARRAGAALHVLGDAGYPPLLAAIDTPPPVVWVRGRGALLRRAGIAVVGARNASAAGLRSARAMGAGLGAEGMAVISGLARGIDAAAHESSLATGTVAVLAGGVDRIYPSENAALGQRIAEEGALVSECPMGVEPTGRHFPRRNRLIAGLARGVVLIEAAQRSGSLITARYALDQGREVMACPGSPEDPRASGCNALIREGAALVRGAEDVLEALAAPSGLPGLAEDGAEFAHDMDVFLDAAEADDPYAELADFDPDGRDEDMALAEQVLRLLGPTPVSIDEIARLCGTGSGALSLVLLELDLAGRIDFVEGGRVALAGPGA